MARQHLTSVLWFFSISQNRRILRSRKKSDYPSKMNTASQLTGPKSSQMNSPGHPIQLLRILLP